MRKPTLRFGIHYCEHVTLDDGRQVVLRIVNPSDKQLLLGGFGRLSPESRYLRFMGTRNNISDAELTLLCEVDGIDHFAMGAVIEDANGNEEGIAVARFVRLAGEPEVAEPAITVIDEFQGVDVGRALIERLSSAAWERGIKRFRTSYLRDNRKIERLLAQYVENIVIQDDDEVVTVEFELPGPDFGERTTHGLRGAYDALVSAARNLSRIRLRRTEPRNV
jgi:GNAT superfamily N-acetyltransferase